MTLKKSQKKLHFIGLVSDGGVHSHIDHLENLISICKDQNVKKLNIHAFTDGRDVDPYSGIKFIKRINNELSNLRIKFDPNINCLNHDQIGDTVYHTSAKYKNIMTKIYYEKYLNLKKN